MQIWILAVPLLSKRAAPNNSCALGLLSRALSQRFRDMCCLCAPPLGAFAGPSWRTFFRHIRDSFRKLSRPCGFRGGFTGVPSLLFIRRLRVVWRKNSSPFPEKLSTPRDLFVGSFMFLPLTGANQVPPNSTIDTSKYCTKFSPTSPVEPSGPSKRASGCRKACESGLHGPYPA